MTDLDLSAVLVARVNRLPVAARRVIALGCLQRCYPFYLRSIEDHPERRVYRPVIDRGLELAWARHEGRVVDEDGCRAIAAEMDTFVPQSADDWEGDHSWVSLTFRSLTDELHFVQYETWDDYVGSTLATASGLLDYWYRVVERQAGRSVDLVSAVSTSAFLLELATQARHAEWLRYRAVDADIVRRIRADSERVGAELLAIVDEWRAG